VSGIIIMDAEVDLLEWLDTHQLTIAVWKTNDGYIAKFKQPIHVAEGGSPQPTGSDALSAVQRLVWSLRGARIGTTGPSNIIVPEFSGIEDAVRGATRTSLSTKR